MPDLVIAMRIHEQMGSLLAAPGAWRKLPVLALVALGWLLSPLCWWNDMLINLPIAFGFAKVVSIFHPAWQLPALVSGYWLSNMAGILLMQNGALALMPGEQKAQVSKDLLWSFLTTSVYTGVILLAIKFDWIGLPPLEALAASAETQSLAD